MHITWKKYMPCDITYLNVDGKSFKRVLFYLDIINI